MSGGDDGVLVPSDSLSARLTVRYVLDFVTVNIVSQSTATNGAGGMYDRRIVLLVRHDDGCSGSALTVHLFENLVSKYCSDG